MNGLLSITKINYQRANILKYTIIIYYLSVCGNIASSKFSRNQLDPENPSRIGEPTRTSQVVSGVNHQVKRHITSRMGWDGIGPFMAQVDGHGHPMKFFFSMSICFHPYIFVLNPVKSNWY